MIYIIDFDDVLFDKSGKFTRVCQKIGLDFKSKLYKKSKNKNNIYNYKKHLKLINKTEQDLEKILKNNNFLFKNIIKKLIKLKNNNKLILLTKGNKKFQELKIKHAGIAKYFDKIYITDNKLKIFKTKIMPERKQKKIIFIDDKKQEREKIKKNYAEIKTLSKIT